MLYTYFSAFLFFLFDFHSIPSISACIIIWLSVTRLLYLSLCIFEDWQKNFLGIWERESSKTFSKILQPVALLDCFYRQCFFIKYQQLWWRDTSFAKKRDCNSIDLVNNNFVWIAAALDNADNNFFRDIQVKFISMWLLS